MGIDNSGRDDAGPDVTVAGPGEPEIAVVGGVHGDEPSGVRAVRRLREADLDLQRGVAFVIAHPEAVEAGERYLESDLNRAFPGDDSGDREQRLAAELCDLIEPLTTVSIHDTLSRPVPFALVHRTQPREFDLAADLPVPHVVDHSGANEGTITTCGLVVEIEVGSPDVEAGALMAEQQARAFLRRVDALPGEPPEGDPDYFHMTDRVPRPEAESIEVHAANFERVPAGTAFATADGRELVADEPFYPILLSARGYADVLGFEGRKIGDSLADVYDGFLADDVESPNGSVAE